MYVSGCFFHYTVELKGADVWTVRNGYMLFSDMWCSTIGTLQ